MTRDELREKVARAIAQNDEWWEDYTLFAERAIAVVLDEAAKVAEAFPAHTHGNLATAPPHAAEQAADEIAAAIRGLKGGADD